MGWGTKRAAPQPEDKPARRVPEHAQAKAAPAPVMHQPVLRRQGGVDETPTPEFAANHRADMEWGAFRAKKGWTAETLAIILGEFIREAHLSAQLLAWAKKRRS